MKGPLLFVNESYGPSQIRGQHGRGAWGRALAGDARGAHLGDPRFAATPTEVEFRALASTSTPPLTSVASGLPCAPTVGTHQSRVPAIDNRASPTGARTSKRVSHLKGEYMANIRPLHDRIIVKRVKEDEKTKGGIIIPDTAKEKPIEGEVVAVGNGKILEDGTVRKLDVKVGDRVLFGKYSGTEVKVEAKSGSSCARTTSSASSKSNPALQPPHQRL